MKKYYIKLKPNLKMSLSKLISQHIKVSKDEADLLISQGSVWDNILKKRLKDKDMAITSQEICINRPDIPVEEYEFDEKNIKYEDEYFLIVFKEAGVYSCPTPESDINCLSWGIQKYFNKYEIDFSARPVNRLDKPTQGLMFFSKSDKADPYLHGMFKNRDVKKLYLAITPKFEIKKKELIIRNELEWNKKKQEAISYIKYIKEKDDFNYFIVYPLTGRTHQIRKHFKEFLMPIYGDYLYGDYRGFEGIGLICFSYKFKHPFNGKMMNIEYLPEEYRC